MGTTTFRAVPVAPPISRPDRSAAPTRPLLLVGGVIAIGLGVSLALRSGLGAGPWDVAHEGLARTLGADVGWIAVIVGVAAFLLWFPLRLRPGPGTLVAAIGTGLVVQALLPNIPTATRLPVQLAMTLVGAFATGVGVACCLRSRLGPSPRDGIAVGIARFGLPLWWVRIGVDASLVALGALLGGRVGVGTLIEVVAVGPVIAMTLAAFKRRDSVATT